MSFTGKATFSAGASLPEVAEDVSDLIGIVSPYETPLLHHLGDPRRAAASTVHEWLEDQLLPNIDQVDDDSIANPTSVGTFGVANAGRFRVGDQIRLGDKLEIMLVTAVNVGGGEITVTRQYGGSPTVSVVNGDVIRILGNAALEGDERPAVRFTNRSRRQNYTQIFTAGVEVSGSMIAARTLAVADELDYQKQERLRELLRDLENCVINGTAHAATPQGAAGTRRTMRGILASITTNLFQPGAGGIPDGAGDNDNILTEEVLNAALRRIWEQSSARIDTIVCGGLQKRRINEFLDASQRTIESEDPRFRQLINIYESDFGVCRVLLSRWVPSNTLLLLDSSRIEVLPLSGRSFHYKPLASRGDSETGQLIGEYTLEFRNENAHGVLRNLGT